MARVTTRIRQLGPKRIMALCSPCIRLNNASGYFLPKGQSTPAVLFAQLVSTKDVAFIVLLMFTIPCFLSQSLSTAFLRKWKWRKEKAPGSIAWALI